MIGFLALSGAALLLVAAAHAGPLPVKVGQCVDTAIKDVGTRLEGVPDSGDAVRYADGGSQVSYDTIKGLKGSRAGDPVRLCLKSLPENCPPGDDRGKSYRATDLRTHSSWVAFDSEHMCGGA
jgi:hypothetical protein